MTLLIKRKIFTSLPFQLPDRFVQFRLKSNLEQNSEKFTQCFKKLSPGLYKIICQEPIIETFLRFSSR